MGLAVKLFNYAARATGLSKAFSKGAAKLSGFIRFGKDPAKAMRKEYEAGIRYFVPKPGIKFPTCPETLAASNPVSEISKKSLKNDIMSKAELGNVSLRLEKAFANEKPAVEKMLRKVFPGSDLSIRAKSSNSIYSKLERVVKEENTIIKTDADAHKMVKDSIGGRITLPNLTEKDFYDVIRNAKVNGVDLTAREKRMVMRYFKNPESLSPAQLKTAQSVAKDVKILLAERQSEGVHRRLMLGMMKDALNRNVTTIEKLKANRINQELLEELSKNTNIEPFRVTKFCNYRGAEGIAYFSDRQINQIKKIQLATGEKFSIITCDADVDLSKYGMKYLSDSQKAAIKKSGYTTAQMNFVSKDGNLCELQITGQGTHRVYNPEHVKYDAAQGKNTLGPLYDDYKSELKGLKQELRSSYDNYFNDLYNTSRESTELFIKTQRPVLDSRLSQELSIENMIRLEKETMALEAEKYNGFVPHYAEHLNFAA